MRFTRIGMNEILENCLNTGTSKRSNKVKNASYQTFHKVLHNLVHKLHISCFIRCEKLKIKLKNKMHSLQHNIRLLKSNKNRFLRLFTWIASIDLSTLFRNNLLLSFYCYVSNAFSSRIINNK